MEMILRSPTLPVNRRTLLPSRAATESAPAAKVCEAALSPLADTVEDELEPSTAAPIVVDPAVEAARMHEDQLREEFESARSRGFRSGYQEGFVEGERDARSALDAASSRLSALADGMERSRQDLLESVEDDAVAIAFEALCRTIGEHASSHEQIVSQVRSVLARVMSNDSLRIRLSSVDLRLLKEHGLEYEIGGHPLSWHADDSLDAGGCIVDTEAGSLEARLDVQLAQVLATLRAARAGQRAVASST